MKKMSQRALALIAFMVIFIFTKVSGFATDDSLHKVNAADEQVQTSFNQLVVTPEKTDFDSEKDYDGAIIITSVGILFVGAAVVFILVNKKKKADKPSEHQNNEEKIR